MAAINFTIPDEELNNILNAFASAYGYVQERDGTKAQFAKSKIVQYIKEVVAFQESKTAVDSARTAAIASVSNRLTIT